MPVLDRSVSSESWMRGVFGFRGFSVVVGNVVDDAGAYFPMDLGLIFLVDLGFRADIRGGAHADLAVLGVGCIMDMSFALMAELASDCKS